MKISSFTRITLFLFCGGYVFNNASFMVNDAEIRYLNALDEITEKLIHRNLFHEDPITELTPHDFIVVSLGCHCRIAWWMRIFNLRFFAFPFDWCITPYKALYNIIDDDFKNYFKLEHLAPSQKAYWSKSLRDFFRRIYHSDVDGTIGAVIDKHFQMLFTHDFSNHHSDTIAVQHQSNHEKYTRRINRLFDAMKSGKHIYFIRLHDITKKEAISLYQLLDRKFPTSPFTLIVLGSDLEEFTGSWDIPGIKNRYVSRETINTASLDEVFGKNW